MKTIISVALTFSLLSGVAQAQSCNRNIQDSTPDARFIISDDEVKDVVTNLTWKRCSQGQTWNAEDANCSGVATAMTWEQALSESTEEWRLPNIKELLSIVEVSCGSPAINESIFPNTSSDAFWTASPYINNAQTWAVLFDDGNDAGNLKSTGNLVRLVKDAS